MLPFIIAGGVALVCAALAEAASKEEKRKKELHVYQVNRANAAAAASRQYYASQVTAATNYVNTIRKEEQDRVDAQRKETERQQQEAHAKYILYEVVQIKRATLKMTIADLTDRHSTLCAALDASVAFGSTCGINLPGMQKKYKKAKLSNTKRKQFITELRQEIALVKSQLDVASKELTDLSTQLIVL